MRASHIREPGLRIDIIELDGVDQRRIRAGG